MSLEAVEAAGRWWIVNPEAENLANLRSGYYFDQISGSPLDEIQRDLQGRKVYKREGKPVTPNYDDTIHTVPDLPIVPGIPMKFGADVGGGTLQPAGVFGQHLKGSAGSLWLIHAEVVCSDMGVDRFASEAIRTFAELPEFHEMVEQWKAAPEASRGSLIEGHGDPAAVKRDEIFEVVVFDHLRKRGINMQPAPSNDPKLRIEALENAISRRVKTKYGNSALLIHPRCKTLRKALSGAWYYRRLQVAGQERFQETPAKTHPYSDIGDAAGYLLLGGGEYRSLQGLTGAGTEWSSAPAQMTVEFNL